MLGAAAEAAVLATLGTDGRRATGCYLTPPPLAERMAERLLRSLGSQATPTPLVLDPAAGTGRLLDAVGRVGSARGLAPRLLGVELQPSLAALARRALPDAHVVAGDGLALLDPDQRATQLGGATFVDGIIANPPYLGEKGNAEVFRALRARVPAWAERMRARQDLQQLFLSLSLSLLRPGGELVFLMNGYWMTTDAGEAIRRQLDDEAEILEVVDFGTATLFDDAPGQHGLLLHARRRSGGATGRVVPRLARLRREVDGMAALCASLDDLSSSAFARDRAPLTASGPSRRWYFPTAEDAALARVEERGVPLGALFETHQGVVSGADKVTARNYAALAGDATPGEGIFLLREDEVARLDLSPDERAHVRPVTRGRQVGPFRVEPATSYIIYATADLPLASLPRLRAHLERFAPVLARRRECQTGRMPWFRLHWPRKRTLFGRPRLVTPRRAKAPRFAFGLAGHCEQSDVALLTDPDDDLARLGALLVVLNSEVVATWCRHRGKQKGPVREYFGRSLEEIPLPAAARDAPDDFAALGRFADGRHRREANAMVRRLYDA